jgi:hypothetical protein
MISDFIAVLLLVYASVIRPDLPHFIIKLFDNGIFRVLIIAIILYTTNHSLKFSVLMAIGFVVTLMLVKEQMMYEGFAEGMEDAAEQPPAEKKVKKVVKNKKIAEEEEESSDEELQELNSMASD